MRAEWLKLSIFAPNKLFGMRTVKRSETPHYVYTRTLCGIIALRKNFLTLNMLTREQIIAAFNKLPEEFSVEQAIDEIILLEKIETGLAQSKANDVIPDEQLDKELPEWLR